MSPYTLSLVFLVNSVFVFAQSPVDSILSRLNPENPVVLNKQLYQLVDHGLFRKINPDNNTWPELTASIAEKAMERADQLDAPARVIIASHLAEVLSRSKQVGMAYSLINQALREAGPMRGQPKAYTYYKYADIFSHLKRLDSAIFYAEKALDIVREIPNDSIEKVSLQQIASLCYQMRNHTKAGYYFKILANHKLAKDDERRGYLNTLALTFRRRQLYDSAIYYFKEALPYAAGDTAWLGLLNGNIGYIYYMQKQYDKALPGLLRDAEYSFKARSFSSAWSALASITSIYIIKKDMPRAKLHYDSLARHMQHTSDKETLLEFLKISADYYKAKGDMTRSVDYLERYISLNDSIQNDEINDRASELNAQFDFDRQMKKIGTLEMQSQLQADENRLKNYLLIGTSVFIILGLVLIYVLVRSNRFKNITNRQITEQAERLNELNTTKDKLFSIISHDLRGPINSLKALMDMVKKQMVTEQEFRHFSGQLQNNVEYVHFTLDNLLQWSKSQLQGIQARPSTVSLMSLANENFNLLSEPAKLKGIQLVNNIRMDASVFADPDQISLVFRNLISNAIKFTDAEGIITLSSETKQDREVITVRDTGTGMTEEVKQKLFQMNNNHSSAGTAGEKGTGLGLTLCLEMIEKNNGKIHVESVEGEGTSFIFSLPKG
jgi:signal transduction histidine kinase